MSATTTKMSSARGSGAAEPPEQGAIAGHPRQRVVAVLAALTMIATLITLGAPTPAAAAAVEATGWAYASQPSTKRYTPSGYNSEGEQNVVYRLDTGRYLVIFPGLNRTGQEVQVVAQGNGDAFCGLDLLADADSDADYGLRSRGSDLYVYVNCNSGRGVDQVDARFVVSMTGQNGPSSLRGAGALVGRDGYRTRGYTASGEVHSRRTATGTYEITFYKQSALGANLQVTAVSGSFGNWCTIASFGDVDGSATAVINCWSIEWLADADFSVRLTLPQPGNVAYGQTTTIPVQWQGPTGSIVGMRVAEPSGGRQSVTFPDLNGFPPGLMVTPMTNGPVRCTLHTWRTNPVSTTVGCRDADDRLPTDVAFSLWARTPPSTLPVFTVPTTTPPKFPGFPPKRGR